MPPVFGPVSPVADPLEVLRRRERHHATPVGEREDGHLLAHEQLLDHDRPREGGGRAQTLVELLHGLADEDALPRRQPVDLDDARGASNGERLGRRNAGRSQNGLREALRALDPRGRAAGAEDGDPVPAQEVGDTRRREAPPGRPRRDRCRGCARGRAGSRRPRPAPGGSRRAARSRGCRERHAASRGPAPARASTRARARARPTRPGAPSRRPSLLPAKYGSPRRARRRPGRVPRPRPGRTATPRTGGAPRAPPRRSARRGRAGRS